MRALDKLVRRWQLKAMEHIDTAALVQAGNRRLLERFQRVARDVPAYAALLKTRGILAEKIRTPADVQALCPILDKQDVFGSVPIEQLCVGGRLGPLAGVLTSSGQGGRFAFGLSTHRQNKRAAKAIELAMEYAFGTDRCRTLLINALPMGVRFSCSTVTVAETSVREDMVCALVEQFSPSYDQTVLVTDPLFCKRILDYSRATGLEWERFKIHVILGEETFGEAFRHYVASRLGQDPERWTRGFVGSSMGVGELGLNLFFETRETVRIRQLAYRRRDVLSPALGDWPGRVPPLVFVYNPMRIFVEIIEPDVNGFGALALSTLDPSLMLPLIRYRTGDRARLVSNAEIARALQSAGQNSIAIPKLPMIAVAGREKDVLPDGRTLLDIKDALYARTDLADGLSGAFRVETQGSGLCLHLQMREGAKGRQNNIAEGIAACIPHPASGPPDRIELWTYDAFPFGRCLDYERKFNYYTGASQHPD